MFKKVYIITIIVVSLILYSLYVIFVNNGNRNTDVKETTQDIAVSSSAVGGVEQNAHKFKTCFGDGKFIEYHERDITIGEKKVNGNTFPIIYSINQAGNEEIIYEKWNGKRWDAYDSFLAADTL